MPQPFTSFLESESGEGGLASDVYDLRSKHSLITAYLGPESNEEEIHALIDWKKKEIADSGCTIAYIGDEEELSKRTAQAIDRGLAGGYSILPSLTRSTF